LLARCVTDCLSNRIRPLAWGHEREPPPREPERSPVVALPFGVGSEPGERLAVARAQGVGLGCLPVVERRTVPERETREEVAGVETDRIHQATLIDRAAELDDVDPHTRSIEVDGLPFGLEPPIAQGGSKDGEGPPQRPAGLLLVRFGPQQRGEDRTPLRLLGDCEIRQQRRRLPRIGDNGRPARDGTRSAKQGHAKIGQSHLLRNAWRTRR